METPGRLNSTLMAVATSMLVAAPAYSQGESVPPPSDTTPTASSPNTTTASDTGTTPSSPPAQSSVSAQNGEDQTCKRDLSICKEEKRRAEDEKWSVKATLAHCQEALRQCQSPQPASQGQPAPQAQPAAPRVVTRQRTQSRNGKTTWSEEEKLTLPPDRTDEILAALNGLKASAPQSIQLPAQVSVTVNQAPVTVNPAPVTVNLKSNNTGVTDANAATPDRPTPVDPAGLDLYGRMGLGTGHFFDKKGGTSAPSAEGWGMVRSSKGNFGFGARAAYEVAPDRAASIEDMGGTVPTHSLVVQGCAERAAPEEGGVVAGLCAGVQREVANDVALDKNNEVKISGWTRYAQRAMAYVGLESSRLIGNVSFSILGRIGMTMGRRDAVAADNKDSRSVPEAGLTIGVKFD